VNKQTAVSREKCGNTIIYIIYKKWIFACQKMVLLEINADWQTNKMNSALIKNYRKMRTILTKLLTFFMYCDIIISGMRVCLAEM